MKAADIHEQLKSKRAQCGDKVEPLVALFSEIRKKFLPVMRHYFTERHKIPASWFAMRLNYTRSVATTSIVGHILGLGDRHSSNILMDNVTGEVVHIDLGIAFDQVTAFLSLFVI
jgi:serine-protein kinase ATM